MRHRVYGDGELQALTALRSYQKNIRRHFRNRDEMVMMNTWGDRSQDTKVNEAFCLQELERAAKLGITHFQIDDGWQVGKSPNSAVAKGSLRISGTIRTIGNRILSNIPADWLR